MAKFFMMLILFMSFALPASAQENTGSLTVTANGEDFVRQGFVSKDGWSITFDHVYVTVSQIRAYQTTPFYNPNDGEILQSAVMVGLPGGYTLDLAEGDADAAPLVVGTLADVPAGYYNALSWRVAPDEAGYALQLIGTATRDGETLDFTLSFAEAMRYDCGAFIGDSRLGALSADGEGVVEMTFHFDHIFGDAELPADDGLNMLAPGFEPFAAMASDGKLIADDINFAAAMREADYALLIDILPTLGHTGEGHCHVEVG